MPKSSTNSPVQTHARYCFLRAAEFFSPIKLKRLPALNCCPKRSEKRVTRMPIAEIGSFKPTAGIVSTERQNAFPQELKRSPAHDCCPKRPEKRVTRLPIAEIGSFKPTAYIVALQRQNAPRPQKFSSHFLANLHI